MRSSPGITAFGIGFILVGVFFLPVVPFFSIPYLIIGVGCFFLEPLIRYLAITVSVFGIILNTVRLISLLDKNIPTGVIIALAGTYLVHLAVIYFFTRPKIKAQFRN